MPTPFEQLSGLDKLIHEPARLAILTALQTVQSADFMFLQRITGMNKGNLSIHLSKLEAAGLVEIRKEFVRRKPRTLVLLTSQGKETLDAYWQQLDGLRAAARRWNPPEALPGNSAD